MLCDVDDRGIPRDLRIRLIAVTSLAHLLQPPSEAKVTMGSDDKVNARDNVCLPLPDALRTPCVGGPCTESRTRASPS